MYQPTQPVKEAAPQENEPMLVYGIPVSGLDGQPTELVIRGERVDLPSKFNQKESKYTDIGFGIAFWLMCIAFGALIAVGIMHKDDGGDVDTHIMTLLRLPAPMECLHVAGSVGIGIMMMWLFLQSIKYQPGFVVWFAMTAGWLVFLGTTAFLIWHMYAVLGPQLESFKHRSGVGWGHVEIMAHSSQLFGVCIRFVVELSLACMFGMMGIIYAFFACFACCCCASTLELTIKLFQAAGIVLDKYKCTMGVAIVTALITKVFIGLWLGATISMIDLLDGRNNFHQVVGPFLGMILIFFWVLGVAGNVAHVTYCKLVAYWYFNSDRQDSYSSNRISTFSALGSAVTVHFGSICFGSLLVALIQTAQVAAALCKNQMEESDELIVKIICAVLYYVLQTVLRWIEDIAEFFNKLAYCHVATYNTNFCDSVRSTMKLLMASGMKLLVNDHYTSTVISLWTLLMMYPVLAYLHLTANSSFFSFTQAADVGRSVVFIIEIGLGFMFLVNAGSMMESTVLQLFVCYAEHPETLAKTHPEIAMEFHKATANYWGSLETGPDAMQPSNDVMGNNDNLGQTHMGKTGIHDPQAVAYSYQQPGQAPQQGYPQGQPQMYQQPQQGYPPQQGQYAPQGQVYYPGQPQNGVPTGMPVQHQPQY